jgi:uncharacterized repeat protein (TIGR04052 family)
VILGLTNTKMAAIGVVLGLSLLAGCGDDSSSSSGSGGHGAHDHTGGAGGTGGTGGSGGGGGGQNAMPVEIAFEGRVGKDVFDCAATYTLGTAQSQATITDYRLYVYDVKLHKADGTSVPVELDQDGLFQYQNLALLDFENKTGACANGTAETNMKIKGKAPEGTYDGVSFVVGVPFELNHGDAAAAPSPLNLTAMFWSWNDGYKFLRIDSKAMGAMKAFNMHLGSTGCVADAMGKVTSCAQPNRPTVELSGFDPLAGKVVIDYAALVAGNDISTDTGGAPGCMSGKDDPECAASMGTLGIHIADGTVHPHEQVVFKGE